MGYQEIGVIRRRTHECDLPGGNGLPLLDEQGALVGLIEGQVIRCDCGRAWVLRFRGWRRARWWTVRRAARA